jgi:hypothetical protein
LSPNKGVEPVQITATLAEDANLGTLGDAVNGAATPHKDQHAPGVALVLFADLDKESAKAALKALGKLEGVDAEGSTADAEKGEISIKLAGGKELDVEDVLAALKEAGVEATTTK